MLQLYKYSNLIQKKTPYAKKMKALSNRIFGEVVRETPRRSMRTVKILSEEPKYKTSSWINFYPRHVEIGHLTKHLRDYGLFRDEHQDYKEEQQRLRTLRGKEYRPFGSGGKKSKTLLDTVK